MSAVARTWPIDNDYLLDDISAEDAVAIHLALEEPITDPEQDAAQTAQDAELARILSELPVLFDDSGTSAFKKREKDKGRPDHVSGLSPVDPQWEVIDPTPDIRVLFVQFDAAYFGNTLGNVEVRWSKQMMSCAGICRYESRAGYCVIGLSLPLLKLRPRKDLVETLLHEMIHAYLFVTKNNRDRDDHGENFHEHMFRINKHTGASITVYHSFHDEVEHYRQHIWRCNGPCQYQPPYFGYVKRSRNRAPSKADNWWADHVAKCNGEYTKIQEPEGFRGRKRKGLEDDSASDSGSPSTSSSGTNSQGTLDTWLGSGSLHPNFDSPGGSGSLRPKTTGVGNENGTPPLFDLTSPVSGKTPTTANDSHGGHKLSNHPAKPGSKQSSLDKYLGKVEKGSSTSKTPLRSNGPNSAEVIVID